MTAILHEARPAPVLGPRPRPGQPAAAGAVSPTRSGCGGGPDDDRQPPSPATSPRTRAGRWTTVLLRADPGRLAGRDRLVGLGTMTRPYTERRGPRHRQWPPGTAAGLLSAPGFDFEGPRISPDGRLVACLRAAHDSYEAPGDVTLVVAALDGRALTAAGPASADGPATCWPGLDRRPLEAAWAPDSGVGLLHRRRPGQAPGLPGRPGASGEVTRLTADDGAYDNLCPAPDGRWLYALRAAIDEPPAPVRLDLTATGGPRAGPAGQPGARPRTCRARLEELEVPTGPPTGPPSGAGWCCRTARSKPRPRRCCSGCTAAR